MLCMSGVVCVTCVSGIMREWRCVCVCACVSGVMCVLRV